MAVSICSSGRRARAGRSERRAAGGGAARRVVVVMVVMVVVVVQQQQDARASPQNGVRVGGASCLVDGLANAQLVAAAASYGEAEGLVERVDRQPDGHLRLRPDRQEKVAPVGGVRSLRRLAVVSALDGREGLVGDLTRQLGRAVLPRALQLHHERVGHVAEVGRGGAEARGDRERPGRGDGARALAHAVGAGGGPLRTADPLARRTARWPGSAPLQLPSGPRWQTSTLRTSDEGTSSNWKWCTWSSASISPLSVESQPPAISEHHPSALRHSEPPKLGGSSRVPCFRKSSTVADETVETALPSAAVVVPPRPCSATYHGWLPVWVPRHSAVEMPKLEAAVGLSR
eukprot:3654090-Prymnesium_polylepis.1